MSEGPSELSRRAKSQAKFHELRQLDDLNLNFEGDRAKGDDQSRERPRDDQMMRFDRPIGGDSREFLLSPHSCRKVEVKASWHPHKCYHEGILPG